MFRSLMIPALAAGLVAGAAAPASAQGFTLSFDLGTVRSLSGEMHNDATGILAGQPASVQAREYDEIYDSQTNFAVTLGYLIGADAELRVGYFRTMGEAGNVQVGSVGGAPLFAEFSDYTVSGFDFGFRTYFGQVVQPYFGTSAGWATIEAIDGTFTVPSSSLTFADVPMTNDTTVIQFALSAGLHVPIGDHFGIYGGVDLRWLNELDDEDGLAGTGLEGLNDDTARWLMPISIGARIRF